MTFVQGAPFVIHDTTWKLSSAMAAERDDCEYLSVNLVLLWVCVSDNEASDIDACWTKNQGKHTHIWGLPPLLRERPVLLIAGCHIYIHVFVCVCVCVSMMRGGDGQRLSQRWWHRWALMRTWRCGILFLLRRCGIRAACMFQNEN